MKINAMMNMSYSFVRYKRKKEEMEGGREEEGREDEVHTSVGTIINIAILSFVCNKWPTGQTRFLETYIS